jgi:tRNA nucleotidyltransferase/poly(A) polymerase
MVDELMDAVQNPKIKEALAVKVTYERIGKETDQMMAGNNPELSVKYLYDFKLFTHLLKFPKTCEKLQNQEKVDKLTH